MTDAMLIGALGIMIGFALGYSYKVYSDVRNKENPPHKCQKCGLIHHARGEY